MKKSTLIFALPMLFATVLVSVVVKAQSLSTEAIKAQMVKEWQRSKAFTILYLNTMPADKYDFRAVDSIRSFAQQMLHLAQGNLGLMSIATDITPPPFGRTNLEGSPTAASKDSVMYYVTASYDYCINAIQTTDIDKWGEPKKVFNRFEETRFAMMMKTLEHQAHHRGQTTIYIRLLGIKPPQEMLFGM